MGWEAYFTLGVLGLVLSLLAISKVGPDVILIGGLALLLVAGIVDAPTALAGMANEGMITVGVLYVVGAGLRQTGGVDWVAQRLFGRPKSTSGAIGRLMAPTMGLSAFMNNTPLVAMLIPAVNDWAKAHRISPSKLMIPLSYAAILGGTCTLIGTSTNLVVAGQVAKELEKEFAAHVQQHLPANTPKEEREAAVQELRAKWESTTGLSKNGIRMFDITWVGVPAAVFGCAFIVGLSAWLLPDRKPVVSRFDNPREYTAEMLVPPDSPLIGKSIEEAGLRHLPGLFLAEIDRDGTVLAAVAPEEPLRANDRLVFVGVVESVLELQRMRGLLPAGDQVFKLASPRVNRCLIEAVVSPSCPAAGKTIRDSRFRTQYNAVVIAVARNGERMAGKIGDIVLRAGDTLLLETHRGFAEQHRNSRDFLLLSRLEDSTPPFHERSLVAIGILLALVVGVTFGLITMLKAAMLAAGAMIFTRCCTVSIARRSVDWEVLLSIAASFGIGAAIENSGAARAISGQLMGLARGDPWWTLAALYFVTLIVTELITNNAAAALMFPLAMAAARALDANAMPFVVAVMMAASAGFATPIGYQTNLMVYGPGGYKFGDYLRVGVPLDILVGVVTCVLAPLVWHF